MALANISGIPDKHWQPPFVVFETTYVHESNYIYFIYKHYDYTDIKISKFIY